MLGVIACAPAPGSSPLPPGPIVAPIAERPFASTESPPVAPNEAPAPSEPAPPAEPSPQSPDCVLDPSMCGPPKSTPPSAAAPTDDLPETLGPPDVRRGIDGVKPQIQECARMHGATPKLQVLIQVRVAGISGMVTQASVVRPKLAAGLEHCIVAAAHRAMFPRFRKEKAGAVVKVELP